MTLGTALAAGLFIRRLPVAANGSNLTFESWNGFPSFTPTSCSWLNAVEDSSPNLASGD
jgi:hypothetical protein